MIALVNNDVVLDSNWAARVMDAFADPQVAFAACRLVQRRIRRGLTAPASIFTHA